MDGSMLARTFTRATDMPILSHARLHACTLARTARYLPDLDGLPTLPMDGSILARTFTRAADMPIL